MIADARLSSTGFGGADADLVGPIRGTSGGIDGCIFGLDVSEDCLWLAGVGVGLGCVGANASSASLSVTLWDRSFGCCAAGGEAGSSKSNLVRDSRRIEN